VTATNPSDGVDYSSVRFDFVLSGPSSLADGSFSVKYQEGSNLYDLPLTVSEGKLVGYFGPETGFPMPKGYSATTNFKVTANLSAPVGNYTLTVQLKDLSVDPNVVLATATGNTSVVADTTPPTMSAISFAGKAGTGSGSAWTVDISDVTNETLLDTGTMTVSEVCTLQSKTVDGVDVSSWCNPVTLHAGENTGSIKSLLGFTQPVTFDILRVQDVNNDGYLTVVLDLTDPSSNTTSITLNIKIDHTAPTMVKLTATINGTDVTSTTGDLTCELGSTVSSIKVLLSEPVTVVGTPVVTIDGLGNYGTIALDPADASHKTLIVTPYPGNETSGLVGNFTFKVSAGAVKDLWGNENAETTFTLHVQDTTPPTMSAISFAGKTGTVVGNTATITLDGVTDAELASGGTITVSEGCTLKITSPMSLSPITLASGVNTFTTASILGDTLTVEDLKETAALYPNNTIPVQGTLTDAQGNKTEYNHKSRLSPLYAYYK